MVPCSPTIFGDYNEYGGLNSAEENNVILEYLKNSYPELKNCKNLCDIVTCISQGKVTDVSLMMIKRNVYLKFIEDVGNRIPFKKQCTFKRCLINKLKEDTEEYLEKVKRSDFDFFKQDEYLCSLQKKYFLDYTSCCDRLIKLFKQAFQKNDEQLKLQILDSIILMKAFSLGRLIFIPNSCGGSQEIELSLADIIADTIKKEIKEQVEMFNLKKTDLQETIFFH